jgi:transcriptional regulator with XRE-family HTH domain
MNISSDELRLILGVKLKQRRREKGYTLKEFAAKTGLSFSYLSEIEQGKKYPKPEKIIAIAKALDMAFDELVSTQIGDEQNPLTALLDSPLLKEFPFQFFGIAPREVVDLVTQSPQEAGALLRTFLEIGKTYDMRVEQFLFAALRSYQKMHQNYFADLESAAAKFAAEHRWKSAPPLAMERLKTVLTNEYGYVLDETTLKGYPELQGFRSIWIEGKPPRLLLNPKLLPAQKAFVLGREIGFRYLGLKERAATSSWLKVESFEQVLNHYKASYFSGALFINQDLLQKDLVGFFRHTRWDGEKFLALMRRYEATPEMFLYRLSQLMPKFFNLQEMFYLRFNNAAGSDVYRLTKELNMSRMLVPHGIGLNEHYCRRWLSISLLKDLAHKLGKAKAPLVAAQRSRFLESDAEFFVITLARSLALTPGTNSSISLGFLINDTFKNTVRFGDDPAVPRVEVNETCERCSLTAAQCHERVAPPAIYRQQQEQKTREQVLQRLVEEMK